MLKKDSQGIIKRHIASEAQEVTNLQFFSETGRSLSSTGHNILRKMLTSWRVQRQTRIIRCFECMTSSACVCVCEEYKAVGVCVSYFQIGKRILQSGRE